jgi:hypothetical protein
MPADSKLRTARLALWLATVVSVGCGLAWGLYPLPNAAERLAVVPLAQGSYVGEEVPLTEAEKRVFANVDVVHRRYEIAGARELYVTLIDGSKDRHAVHDPRYCFQGAGWRVLDEQRRPINGGEAHWIRAANEEGRAEAAFWFADGDRRYASLPRYLMNSVLRRMTFGKVGGKPVLVVVQALDGSEIDWSGVDEMIATLRL